MAHDSQLVDSAMSNFTIAMPSSPSEPAAAAALAATLQADSVSCEVLRFFLGNERAMDSAKGIAAWWVHRDELAVQPSLHRLVACGAILAHTLTSGVTLYKLSPDPAIRAWLRNALGVSDVPRATATARKDNGSP
jgi:hypothetical protein